jgi:hypothetical protein
MVGPALIAETAYPVFMWFRTVDIGAHHACWLVLQALFMTASAPPTMTTSIVTASSINERVFIVTANCWPVARRFLRPRRPQ